MKYIIMLLALASLSVQANIECEQRLVKHFEKEGQPPYEKRTDPDYMSYKHNRAGECVYKVVTTPEAVVAITSGITKYPNSRHHEIIRVCTAISLMIEKGMKAQDIESGTLDYQNGWSRGMREPIKEIIEEEIASKGQELNCDELVTSGRASPEYKSFLEKHKDEIEKDPKSWKKQGSKQ